MSNEDVKTVAVVGASADRSKYGNKSVRAHLKCGWQVYPVNSKGGEIEGLRAWRSIAEIPVKLDRISMYVPPEVGLSLLPEIAAARPREVYLNPGTESDALVTEAKRLGLAPIQACSILALGLDPSMFP
jgi:uncharacterized protein